MRFQVEVLSDRQLAGLDIGLTAMFEELEAIDADPSVPNEPGYESESLTAQMVECRRILIDVQAEQARRKN